MPSDNLKALRERLGLSQAEAAALVRVSANTWARWERGEMKPSPGHQALIDSLPSLVKGKLPKPSPES